MIDANNCMSHLMAAAAPQHLQMPLHTLGRHHNYSEDALCSKIDLGRSQPLWTRYASTAQMLSRCSRITLQLGFIESSCLLCIAAAQSSRHTLAAVLCCVTARRLSGAGSTRGGSTRRQQR